MSRNEDAIIHLNWAREAEKQQDYLRTRMEYLKCVESLKQAGDNVELEKATKEYESFVKRDPIFKVLLNGLLPIIKSNPGILQSDITKNATALDWALLYNYNREIAKGDICYALYFGDKFGLIQRIKKGRTYELYPKE